MTGRGTVAGRGTAAAVALLLASASLVGCSSSVGASAEDGFVTGDGGYATVPPEKRTAPVELKGTTLDGKELSTASFKGKVVVVNVWGSWCNPCRHEAPQLVKAAQASKGKAEFVGLNTKDTNKSAAVAFNRVAKVPYPSLYDPDGRLLLSFGHLPAKAIPSTLILDAQGRPAARILGEASATTLTEAINDVAAGK